MANDLQALTSKYHSKKRGLAKKRKEMIELQEANKHLKGEVKSKKKVRIFLSSVSSNTLILLF